MTDQAYQHAVTTAGDPHAAPQQAFDAASGLDAAFQRGEHRTGALPEDAATLMLHLYDRAGEGGIAQAWPAIAHVYSSGAYGPGVEQSESRALAFLRHGAATGGREAIVAFIRATHFASPDIAEQFTADAAGHLNALLGQNPDPTLLVLAAWMLHAGQGYAPDPARARAMLDVAAAAGDRDAHFELYVYDSQGVAGPADPESALHHLRTAADAGHPRAMGNLGGMYATGTGVERDEAQSLQWYRRAAHAGNARAAYNLSVMYATGLGAPVDADRSARYRELATELGYREA